MRRYNLAVITSHEIRGKYIRGTTQHGHFHVSEVSNGKGLALHGAPKVPFTIDALQAVRDELDKVIEFMQSDIQ